MNWIVPIWFLFLVGMAVLFELETHWISKFSIFTIFFIGLFVRYGIAVPFSNDVNPQVTGLSITAGQLANYYVALVLTYLCIFIGLAASRRTLGRMQMLPLRRPWTPNPAALYAVSGVILAVVLLVWVVLPWQSFFGGLGIYGSRHSGIDFRFHRVTYGTLTLYSNSLLTYLGSFARIALLPVILWVLFFHGSRSLPSRFLFAISLVVVAAIDLASGQKMPLILIGVGYLVASVVSRGWRALWNWRFGAAAALIVVAIPVLYKVQYPAESVRQLISVGIYRLTSEYSRVAQLRFIFYPDQHPYLHGFSSYLVRGAAHVVGINTGDAVSPETYIPNIVIGPQYRGTWNAGFFSDAWADFGFVGVVAASLAVGFLLMVVFQWFELSPKGPTELGTYTAVCLAALFFTEVSFLTTLWTYGFLSSFIVYLALRTFPLRRRRAELQPSLAAVRTT